MGLIEQKIQVELNAIGQATVNALVNSLYKNKKIASGNLKQSIEFKAVAKMTNDDVRNLKISFQVSMDDYWYYVENGRKKGTMPPVAAIEKWVRRKENLKIKKTSLDKQGRPRYKSIAFAIALKIKKKGTKGSKFFSKVINDAYYQAFNLKIAELVGEAVELYISKLIAK